MTAAEYMGVAEMAADILGVSQGANFLAIAKSVSAEVLALTNREDMPEGLKLITAGITANRISSENAKRLTVGDTTIEYKEGGDNLYSALERYKKIGAAKDVL